MDFVPTSTEVRYIIIQLYIIYCIQGYIRYSESGCVDKLINEEIIEGVKFEALTSTFFITCFLYMCDVYQRNKRWSII